MKKAVTLIFIGGLAAALLYTVALLPPMGDADNPTNLHIVPRYHERGMEEAGTGNLVAAVVLNYRGYDTMVEVSIFSAALAGIFAVLGTVRKRISRSYIDRTGVRFSFISGTTVLLLMPLIIVFSVYTILYGADLPGGGFQGGAAIGAGVMISSVAYGFHRAQRRLSYHVRIILESTAISAFFIVGTVGVIGGAAFLTYMLPALTPGSQSVLRTAMLLVVQFGIGIKVGVICTSILFALMREEDTLDVEHAG